MDERTLALYRLTRGDPPIRAAEPKRDWMDATPSQYAYRCLPLSIANAHGWEILCGRSFMAYWTGGARIEDVKIGYVKGSEAPQDAIAGPASHFGSATLTFHIPMLFQTPPGWNLMITGPINRPKDAIAPLTGIVETDWSPYTFTMNWIFTRKDTKVMFEEGEPIAHIFPLQRGAIQSFRPEIRELSSDPDLEHQYTEWGKDRGNFNQALRDREPEAAAQKWQKSYFQGNKPDGAPGAKDHQTKLRLRDFKARG